MVHHIGKFPSQRKSSQIPGREKSDGSCVNDVVWSSEMRASKDWRLAVDRPKAVWMKQSRTGKVLPRMVQRERSLSQQRSSSPIQDSTAVPDDEQVVADFARRTTASQVEAQS
jgi:hypothetical protein